MRDPKAEISAIIDLTGSKLFSWQYSYNHFLVNVFFFSESPGNAISIGCEVLFSNNLQWIDFFYQ